MAYPQGVNFRATLGFVTDGTNESGDATTPGLPSYPRTTAQGNTVGWEVTTTLNTRDRSTSVDRRLAGIQFTQSVQADFRFDLPSAGSYNIRFAAGDISSVNDTKWSLCDTNTVLRTLTTGTNVSASSFKDATDTVLTDTTWPTGNTAVTHTFATTICRFRSNPAGAVNLITHAYVESAGGGGTDTPVNPAAGALTLSGYAPTVARTANQSVTPSAGTLAITGYAPSVAQSSSTAISPGAGSLVLTGYAPTITQPQAVAPGAGSLTITGFAPTVTQGITTTIAPGVGSLAISGYAPAVTQSANQSAAPLAGTLAITGYAPALTQTANQSVLPAVGSLTITGYAPTIAQAAASPSLTPGAGLLSITGYAPSVVQSAPVTKIGGDDVPREEDDERIEIWESRKPQPKRDDSLDKVVREAYAKATGKPIAAAVAKPGPSVRAPAPVAEPDPFDYDEDDLEVLLLSY